MGNYFNKFLSISKDFLHSCRKTFFENGYTGYFKFALAAYFGLYAGHFFLKHNGLLPKKSVKGDHIFITGGGNGIGAIIAKKFAKLGAKVSVVDINLEWAQKVTDEINSSGGQAKAIYCDVANIDSVKNTAVQAVEAFGDVDILINNAGVVSGKKASENDEKNIVRTLMVNTVAHGYTVKRFLPKMLEKNKGHIVTVASSAGFLGASGLTDYCASKFGAVGFDEALRLELRKLGSNVKTTCFCPGIINTELFAGAQSKWNFLIPVMEPEYVAQRAVNAVLQDEKFVVIPFNIYSAFWFKAILPTSWNDALGSFLGVNDLMNEFKGRQPKK